MCCSCGELGKQAACFPVEKDKNPSALEEISEGTEKQEGREALKG